MNINEPKNPGVIRYRFEPNGSLTIQSIGSPEGRLQRVRIGPDRRLSVMTATQGIWQDLELRAGRSVRNRLLVTLRTARPEKDGIAVTNVARNDQGRALESSGVITGNDADPWHSVDVRPNGLRIESEGKGKRAWRTATDAHGLVQWRSEPAGGGAMAVMESSGTSTRASEVIRDGEGRQIGKRTTWENPNSTGSRSETHSGQTHYDKYEETKDGRTVKTETWTDGQSSSSKTQETEKQGGLTHTKTVETDSDSSGTSTHTTEEWKGKEKNPITGEDNDVYTREETHTTKDGKTETDRWSAAGDTAGNQSSTHVHKAADGSITITTRTVDGKNNGSEHTTIIGKDGKIKKDTTRPIKGNKYGSPTDDEDEDTESDEPEEDDEDDDDGDDDDGDDGDGDDDDGDDGDDDDGGDDDGGDDDGGDDGDMDWDGSDDGRPKLPTPSNALSWQFELPLGATPEEQHALAEAFIAAVKAFIVSGREPDEGLPEIVPGGGRPVGPNDGPEPGGATGEGDWGAEGLPDIKPQAGDWQTIRMGGGQGPIDDWGDWTDPRAMVANALHLAAVVAADPNAGGRGVMRALNVVRGLDSAIQRVGLRH